MVKRFNVKSITRDREYPITKGAPKSRVLYFTANRNGEAEVVNVLLRQSPRLKRLKLDLDFSDIAIKGRGSGGNIVSKFPVKRIELKEAGVSTLGARKVWYDETVRRLNGEGRGNFLGEFNAEDKIMALQSDGVYSLTSFDFSTHFDDKMSSVQKWDEARPVSVVYFDGEKQDWYVKRFLPEFSIKPACFIGEHEASKLAFATTLHHPQARVKYNRRFKHTRDKEDEIINLNEFISLKGVRALGNKLSALPVTEILLEPVNTALESASEPEPMVESVFESAPEPVQESEPVFEPESEPESEPDPEPSVDPVPAKPSNIKLDIKRPKPSGEEGQGSLF
jgi:topoisomerase-4 subunit A